jgi:hypothetical protein
MPKVEESAFSANQFLFKLTVQTAHTLTLAQPPTHRAYGPEGGPGFYEQIK